jgi:hypothetical protein
MNFALASIHPDWHPLLFLLPFFGALVLLVIAARYTLYRRPPGTLEDVAHFVRQVDMLELAALLDPLVPQTLRESLSDDAYRRELDTHIRLVREYLDRVNHNVRVIQNWVAGEYTHMAGKNPEEYNLHERLVVEALDRATELRMYAIAARIKLWVWGALRIDRWPESLLPRIPNLRVLRGVELLGSYRRLTEITQILARGHGPRQQELFETL